MLLGADGKEGQWAPLDVETPFKELIIQLPPQNRYAKEKPELAPILKVSAGPAMPRPAQYEGKTYPNLEEDLTKIQATLKKLTGTDKKQIITPNILRTDFNPFTWAAVRRTPTRRSPPRCRLPRGAAATVSFPGRRT